MIDLFLEHKQNAKTTNKKKEKEIICEMFLKILCNEVFKFIDDSIIYSIVNTIATRLGRMKSGI